MVQWLIIQGRADGKLLAAARAEAVFFGVQQPQPAPWPDERRGAWRLRSLVAWAALSPASMPEIRGAVRKARPQASPQSGQACGSLNSAIGRMAVNGPQAAQAYS